MPWFCHVAGDAFQRLLMSNYSEAYPYEPQSRAITPILELCASADFPMTRDDGDVGADGDYPISRLSLRIPISLSPRPEMFTMTISDFLIIGERFRHSATACDDSNAGMIP